MQTQNQFSFPTRTKSSKNMDKRMPTFLENKKRHYTFGIVSTIEQLDDVSKYLKTKLKASDFITNSNRWGFIVEYRDSDSKILAVAVCSLAYTFYQGPVASIETIKSNGDDAFAEIMLMLDTIFYQKLGLLKVRYFKGIGPRLKLLETTECSDFERELHDRRMMQLEDGNHGVCKHSSAT